MSGLDKLVESNKSTWHMVGMTALTLGFYLFLWAMKNRPAFNSFSKGEVSEWNIYVTAAVFAWAGLIQQAAPSETEDLTVAIVSGLIGFSLQVVLAITIYLSITTKVIHGLAEVSIDERNLKINRFFAFLFSFFYINFKINQIAKVSNRVEINPTKQGNFETAKERKFFISTGSTAEESREISERELHELYKARAIVGETLIWTEGWSEWRTYSSSFDK